MIKDHFKIVLMTLIVFISLSSNAFSADINDESDSAKTKIVLAKQGDIEAQYELGLMNSGEGATSENLVQALFWFGEALKGGHPSAKEKLELVQGKVKEAIEANKRELERLDQNEEELKKDLTRLDAEGKKITEKYDRIDKALAEVSDHYQALGDGNLPQKKCSHWGLSHWCSGVGEYFQICCGTKPDTKDARYVKHYQVGDNSGRKPIKTTVTSDCYFTCANESGDQDSCAACVFCPIVALAHLCCLPCACVQCSEAQKEHINYSSYHIYDWAR
jgi:TPR repeat protein